MKYYLLISTLLISACAQTSFQDFGAKIDNALNKNESKPSQSNTQHYALTVQTIPNDSIVKIMNIKPKYHEGIQLKAGMYDVLVQKQGYVTQRKNIRITQDDVVVKMNLKPAFKPTTTPIKAVTAQEQVNTAKEKTAPVAVPTQISSVEKVVEQTAIVAKPAPKLTKNNKTSKSNAVKDSRIVPAIDPVKRADYLPSELQQESPLTFAEVDDDSIPVYDGGYLKVIDEGFFTDSEQFVSLEVKPAYRSIIFTAKSNEDISISWMLKQKKRYFALDIENTISIPVGKFKGFLAKGESNDLVSIHRAEKLVRGYSKEGTQSGSIVTFFDSNKNVDAGQAVYSYKEQLPLKKTKTGGDSYFFMLTGKIKKGLYVAWYGDKFCFFNLL